MIIKHGYFFLLPVLLLFFACYEQTLTIGQDNGGIITYKVTYYDEFDNLISYLINTHNIDLNSSIFFNKSNLNNLVFKSKNISITNYSIKKLENGRVSEVSFNYSNFEGFPKETPYTFFPVHIYEENKNINYITTLSIFNQSDTKQAVVTYKKLEKKEKELIDGYLSLIKLKFIYKSYKPIIYNNTGVLSKDKKELTYETTLYELINSKNEININFAFKK